MTRSATLPLCAAVLTALAFFPAAALANDQRSSLAAELGWVKFRVAAGRLQVVNANFRENKEYETGNPLVGETEKFSMTVGPRETLVHYARNTPEETLGVHFAAGGEVTIERLQQRDRLIESVSLKQRPDQELQLVVGRGESHQVYSGRTLWHLLLAAPGPAREQLVPILESLRPGWRLAETATELEAALVEAAASGRSPDRQLWAKLVDQLGDGRFSERRAAERQLRASGPAVVAYLQSIDLNELDAERRARIERLLDSLSTTADDLPQRIALWLVDDPAIWLSVLASDSVDRRRAAHVQLEKLLSTKIDFSADADPATRTPQWEALRRRISP